MNYIVLLTKKGVCEEEFLGVLLQKGLEVLFTSYDQETQVLEVGISGFENFSMVLSTIDCISSYKIYDDNGIDWEKQWQLHCKDYFDGKVVVNLEEQVGLKGTFTMKAGPGFGDLSHPTTQLVLKMMAPYVAGQNVIDLGCGSGVLSLASLSLGAKVVLGVDIDQQAIEHAKENHLLNEFEGNAFYGTVLSLKSRLKKIKRPVVLMNMISSEQKNAWKALLEYIEKPSILITSGVHEEERDLYLEKWKGWSLKSFTQKKEWLCFCFIPEFKSP